jgi:hypothetical protein
VATSIPTSKAARRRTVEEEGEPGNAHGNGNGDDLEGLPGKNNDINILDRFLWW